MVFRRLVQKNRELGDRIGARLSALKPDEPELSREPTERDLEYVDEDDFVAAVDALDRITPRRLILTDGRLIEVSDYLDEANLGVSIETYHLESIAHVDASTIAFERLQVHLKDGTSEDWAAHHALEFAELINDVR